MNLPMWFSNLVFWSAQVALLVLAAALLPRVLRLRQPRILLFYWRTVLAISLLLPVLQPWHRVKSTAATVTSIGFELTPVQTTSSPAVSHWQLPDLQSIAPILGLVILGGVTARFVMLLLGIVKLRRLRRAALPVTHLAESAPLLEEIRDRVNARAEFCFSAQVDSPVTFGFRAPVILLPQRFASLEPRFQLAIACHELLHVRRRDWAHHLAEEFLRCLFWFHPAIGWLISCIRLACEQVVDLEVIQLTQERKTYLDALLEFTNARALIATVPAPPFLAECQLVERIALMVKEIRMSRERLVVSLAAVSCCLLLVLFFGARTFPLKAAPSPAPAQNVVQKDVAGRVSGAVSGGIANGVSGGVANGAGGGVSTGISGTRQVKGNSSEGPNVDVSTIWTDTVKRGPMVRQVRGMGSLVRAENSTNLIARITLPTEMMLEVRPDQKAAIDTRKGLVKGHVSGLNSRGSDETRTVYIGLDGPLPEGAVADVSVEASIDIEKIDDTLYVGRPANVPADATPFASASVFKISSDGREAERVVVKLGKPSATTIQVLGGLHAGDKIILSDMSDYDNVDRIRLTDRAHREKR